MTEVITMATQSGDTQLRKTGIAAGGRCAVGVP
jgi:hypothetical protein